MVEEQTPQIYEEDTYSDENIIREEEGHSQVTYGLVDPDQEEEYSEELNRLRDLADLVLQGEFGFGKDRIDALGEDYEEVMKIVYELRTSKWN